MGTDGRARKTSPFNKHQVFFMRYQQMHIFIRCNGVNDLFNAKWFEVGQYGQMYEAWKKKTKHFRWCQRQFNFYQFHFRRESSYPPHISTKFQSLGAHTNRLKRIVISSKWMITASFSESLIDEPMNALMHAFEIISFATQSRLFLRLPSPKYLAVDFKIDQIPRTAHTPKYYLHFTL